VGACATAGGPSSATGDSTGSGTASAPRVDTPRRSTEARQEEPMRIRLVIGSRQATATLADNAAARDLASMLPLTVPMTDLFGGVWERPQLAKRDRSLATVAALLTGGNAEQLTFHLQYAKDNGVTEEELIELITHLAFYAGWPKAFSAMAVAKQVFGRD